MYTPLLHLKNKIRTIRDMLGSQYTKKLDITPVTTTPITTTNISNTKPDYMVTQLSNLDKVVLQEMIITKKIKLIENHITTLKATHEKTVEGYKKANKLMYIQPYAKILQIQLKFLKRL